MIRSHHHNTVIHHKKHSGHRKEQQSSYFCLCSWIYSLVCPHVELWVEHVLDHAAKLHQAVGLQVVQGDVVQRGDLSTHEDGCDYTADVTQCDWQMSEGSQSYVTQV